jgi:geranylgeranyl pyrophosphate synthase
MSETPALARALLVETREATDRLLEACALRLTGQHAPPLGPALAYALRTSGKRVRPALVVASYRSAGGRSAAIVQVGAAVEIVHTYSLVHDDLPCMDDDAQRRGRPTTHVVFDVPTATLIGWLLVPVAVEELCRGAEALGLQAAALGRLAATLLEAGGVRGMIGGQWLDLEAEGRQVPLDELVAIHRAKTGALIEACCVIGAIAAGASASQREALGGYGREIGLAFQIADDVLDATGTTATLGKTAGRDAELDKSTYVSLLGVDRARREAERHARLAVDRLAGSGLDIETLAHLARYIVTRTS